jgi:hypothetical protein
MSEPKPFDYWEFFVAEAQRANSPLYGRFAEGVGRDSDLRAFAATAKKGQPHANILFAAVHFLLLRGAQHPLRRFYPDLNGWKTVEGEDPFPAFKDFVDTHRAELAPIVATRITNTNEVGRCGMLHAGFRAVAAEAGEPLNLIEIGPSAGLNLIWDRYRVRYIRGLEIFAVDTPDSGLVIDCELRGDKIPPLGRAPSVASRVGLELNPVNLDDPDARDWLRALIFPEHRLRVERLAAALKAYASARPEIRAGDALALLPNALRDAPEHQPVCVYHTYVTYQFTGEMREALHNMLTVAGLRRPVWRLSAEGTLEGENPLILQRYHDGTHETRKLALCHPHGAWLEWFG